MREHLYVEIVNRSNKPIVDTFMTASYNCGQYLI